METKAKRTLVKSAPELWELADDLARMEAWMGGLVGSSAPVSIEVCERVPESAISWVSTEPRGRIHVALAESGFGTSVEITAHHESAADGAKGALERLLDELGSPDRRPFSKG